MHAIGAALANGIEDGLGVEVTLGCCLSAKCIRLVGKSHMQCIAIEFGIDGNGGDAHFASGPNNSNGDLATVSNEDFLKHEGLSLPNGQHQSQPIE